MSGPGHENDPYRAMSTVNPIKELTITEIERLAKAGVQISVGPVRPTSDYVVPHPYVGPDNDNLYVALFWDRWHRGNKIKAREDIYGYGAHVGGLNQRDPFKIYAAKIGEKINVFIHDDVRHAIIEDDPFLFPSDSLMAACKLWEQSK